MGKAKGAGRGGIRQRPRAEAVAIPSRDLPGAARRYPIAARGGTLGGYVGAVRHPDGSLSHYTETYSTEDAAKRAVQRMVDVANRRLEEGRGG